MSKQTTGRVLVTGGTGVLGREVARQLTATGHTVRIMSRRPPGEAQAGLPPQVEWVQADLAQRGSLQAALDGVDTVVHAATLSAFSPNGIVLRVFLQPDRRVEVDGTLRLLEAAREVGVAHFLYVSIVGADQVPLNYYQMKAEAEGLVRAAGLPWTIVRATQFHHLVDSLLISLARLPIFWVPTAVRWQPVDPAEVATHIAAQVERGPAQATVQVGGPAARSLGDLATAWLAVRNQRRRMVEMPLSGATGRAFRAGANTCEDCAQGAVTWEAWLAAKYGEAKPARGGEGR